MSDIHPQRISGQLQPFCEASPAIRRQFVFSAEERTRHAPVLPDPIGDELHSPVRGIVHRYPNRALLTPNFSCPSICRFCFRKTKIGQDPPLSPSELDAALDYIEFHKEISEVILSGGEPLASFSGLQHVIRLLEQIDHVDILRIHTRLPLTAPDDAVRFFKDNLLESSKPLYLVLHCNHIDEITSQWKQFANAAHRQGIVLMSQTVLLAGINDSVEALTDLFQELVRNRVRPYYLHHPDQVIGTDHFRVSLRKGRELFGQLRGKLSGIAIPRYILDIPGGQGKVSAEAEAISESNAQFLIRAQAEPVPYLDAADETR